jgi:hypothetical protein
MIRRSTEILNATCLIIHGNVKRGELPRLVRPFLL